MAISRTQAVAATATSATLTSTENGDLILVWAYSSSTTIPTIPSGYFTLVSQAGTQQACACGYKWSQGGETSTGTWTNATSVVCHVYKGAAATGAVVGPTAGSSTSIAQGGVTCQDQTATSWIVVFCGAKSNTAAWPVSLVSGEELKTASVNTACGYDSNGLLTNGNSAYTCAISPTSRWFAFSLEIKIIPRNPYFIGAGASVTTSAGSTMFPTFPASFIADDLMLCVCQTSNETQNAPTVPSGFAELDDQTRMAAGTAATLGSTRLAVFWRRALAGDTNAATMTATNNHTIAQCMGFRGVRRTGDPWTDVGVSNAGTQSPGSTAFGWSKAGTVTAYEYWINGTSGGSNVSTTDFYSTIDRSLAVIIPCHSQDLAGVQAATLNYGLLTASLNSAGDSTTTGTGGGFVMYSGIMVNAGQIASSGSPISGTYGGSAVTGCQAMMLLVLAPTEIVPDLVQQPLVSPVRLYYDR